MIRTGIGFDSHRFETGRPLIVGGYLIPDETGLSGHSDADVLSHAITDAILGAIADGDIGSHFPDTDPQWKGVDSKIFLAHALTRLTEFGARLVNIDATIMAEAPKMRPHIDAVRQSLSETLSLDISHISVKATTLEKMGALGRKEGIAVMAIATVDQQL